MILKSVEKQENGKVQFSVEVEPAAFEAAIAAVFQKNKKSIQVQGFRRGKAPRAIVEGMYGSDVFHDDAASELAQPAFVFGAEEAKLQTVGMPAYIDFKVDETKALTMTFETEVYPEVTLGEYKGLEAVYDEEEVTDTMIDEMLEAERTKRARFVEVERAVAMGDTVIFDFEGFVDGVAFDGGKAENHTLEIGSGQFIPGFEEGMVGMEIGVASEVAVTFPEQYHGEELAGKAAIFKVMIHAIREKEMDAMDDEFAKDLGFDTLVEYKADVKAKTIENNQKDAENDFKSALIMAAAENMACVVPDGMVEEKMDEIINNYAQNMGMVADDNFFQMMGIDRATFSQIMRPNAEMQLKADIMLDKVAEVEAIEVTEEDMEDTLKMMSESYGRTVEEIKAVIDMEMLTQDLKRQKASDIICDSGVKTAAPEISPVAQAVENAVASAEAIVAEKEAE